MRFLKSSVAWTMIGILGSVITVAHVEWDRKIYPGTSEYNRFEEHSAKRARRLAGYRKMNQPDQFMLLQALARTGDGQQFPSYQMNYRYEEMLRAGILSRRSGNIYAAGLNKSGAALSWVERGPANVGGRTRGLIIDPDDATHNTWFAAAVGGGVWKTTDGGSSWSNLTPNLSNLATTVLAMAPSNHDVIYLGTGEGFFNLDAIDGDGIWKSTDRGLNWFQLSSTVAINQSSQNFQNINRIVVDPTNADVVFAATNSGIYRSTDGGSSWGTSYAATLGQRVQHLVANPLNFNTLYAGVNPAGVLKSTNRGVSWVSASSGFSGERTELAVSEVDTNRVFASVDGDFMYFTTDGAANWKSVNMSIPDFLGGQGWYDNTIIAHPYHADTVFVGGVDIFKVAIPDTGGTTTTSIAAVDTSGTAAWLSFENFALPYFGGSMGIGNDLGSASTSAVPSDYVSVEVRFGGSRSQKAHRFRTAAQSGGQTASQYAYQNYVYVPFEVWDVTNNQQLMFSFRDENNDGAFDLNFSTSGDGRVREYMFIHKVTYDSTSPNGSIAVAGGIKHKTIYEITPGKPTAISTWSSSLITMSTLEITPGTQVVRNGVVTPVTDVYNQYPGVTGVGNVHPDQHNLVIVPVSAPVNFKILNANDGGLALSTDGGKTFIRDQGSVIGYNTTQFYGVDKKPFRDQYVAGAQDNGTWISPGSATATSSWLFKIGGDGFDCLWKSDDSLQVIGGSQYNGFAKSTNGGTSFAAATSGLATGSNAAPFLSPLGKSTLEPDVIYAIGSAGVYQSTNFGSSWTERAISSNWSMSSLTTVEVSVADPTVVWAGGGMSSSRRLHVSTNGGSSFVQTNNYSDGLGTIGNVTGIATHPLDRNIAYALFSVADRPKVVRTTDLGQSWQDLSGFGTNANSSNGFPDVAVYSLLVMPHDPSEIWVGTEIGLFISTDAGASWQYSNNGLPSVAIWQMRIMDKQVVVATHGRGVWTVNIDQLPATLPAPKIKSLAAGNNQVDVTFTIRRNCDSVVVFADSTVIHRETNTNPRDVSFSFQSFETATKRIQAVSFLNGFRYPGVAAFISIAFDPDVTAPSLSLSALASPVVNVVRFGVAANEPLISANVSVNSTPLTMTKKGELFFGSYSIISPGNLTVQALGEDTSDNSGSVNRTYQISQFGKPILLGTYTVDGTGQGYLLSGSISVNDVPDEWRMVEAPIELVSAGGVTSFTLGANFTQSEWTMQKKHIDDDRKIGIYQWEDGNWTYQGGEGRQGHVSASVSNGIFAVFYNPDHEVQPTEFDLGANYPNPFNPTTTIRYAVPTESRVILRVYNMLGQEVRTLVNQVRSPGRYEVTWDGRNQAGHAVSSGVYIYRLEATNFVRSRKMLFVK